MEEEGEKEFRLPNIRQLIGEYWEEVEIWRKRGGRRSSGLLIFGS